MLKRDQTGGLGDGFEVGIMVVRGGGQGGGMSANLKGREGGIDGEVELGGGVDMWAEGLRRVCWPLDMGSFSACE